MTGSNMGVNNKNTCVSGRATHAGSTGRLTDKILANPHTALCKEPRRQILKEENHERQCFNRGKQWWDPGNKGDPGLILQRPLLDGGEGKSTCSNNNKINCLVDDKKHEIQDLGHDRDKHKIQIGGIQEYKILWEKGDIQDNPTSCSGIRNLTAHIVSAGALAHITIAEEASTTTTFTPRSLLGLCNPGDTQKRGGADLLGLDPPPLEKTGDRVTGADTPLHHIENKRKRKAILAAQPITTQWTKYKGEFDLPPPRPSLVEHRREMCPSGLALHHPAADLLEEWATYGCPTKTGKAWTKSQMQEAVDQGPHRLALSDKAIAHFQAEVTKKVQIGQAKLVAWEAIKDNPPRELKISPIAAIPHKSKQFWSILDLSFPLRLKQGGILPSVNATTIKMAPKGAIDQLGHALTRIIHAFAEVEYDARIFMAKWDIKDGFWRMDAEEGAEWKFSYVLPQHPGQPSYLVVPTLLQMG